MVAPVNYATLGLRLFTPPVFSTSAPVTGAPNYKSAYGSIGTGKARGTGEVGTTISGDSSYDDHTYTGTTKVTEISPISSPPIDPSAKTYTDDIKGYLEWAADFIFAPNVEYNPVTGKFAATDIGGVGGLMLGPLEGMMQGLGALSRANMEDIAAKAYAGTEGYAVGYLDGQLIGTSPGLFGFNTLSGMVPSDLTYEQQKSIVDNLLSLDNKSGAYNPNIRPEDFPNIATSGLTIDQYYSFDPSTISTPYFPGYTGEDIEASYPGSIADPDITFYDDGSGRFDTFGSGVVRDTAGRPVTSTDFKGGTVPVQTKDWSGGTQGSVSNNNSNNGDNTNDGGSTGGGHTDTGGDTVSEAGMESGGGWGGDALGGIITHGRPQNRTNFAPGGKAGGRIGMAWGGDASDDAADDEMGDVATMESSYSADPDAFSNEDAGMYDGGNDNSGENEYKPTINRIHSNIVSAIQNRPMTPEERYASNAILAQSGMTIEDVRSSKPPADDWEDAWREAVKIDTSKPFFEEEQKGFTSVGDAISQGVGALVQGAFMGLGFREGGEVTQGFVNKDPSSVSDAASIADNRHTSVKAGSFVINQPTNEKHKEKLDRIVADASKVAKMKKGGKAGMVDVALSDGERLIEPEVVAQIEKKYGKNFLDNLNDEGKPEVERRQAKYGEKLGAADGGFLAEQGMELGDVGEDIPYEEYLPVSEELVSQLSKFSKRKPQRGQIKEFIKSLSPEDKLTVLYLTETQSTTDPIESMEAIGEVVKNRMESDYYDFKDLKTLDDVLLKQTKKGAFHFAGLEPSTLYARAKEVAKGTADMGLRKAAAAAQNTLDPETEGTRRLPFGTVFYTRKDAPSQWMRESKDLEYSTELGGHEFYRTFQRKEFP